MTQAMTVRRTTETANDISQLSIKQRIFACRRLLALAATECNCPEREMLLAVITTAVADLGSEYLLHRDSAIAFFWHGDTFPIYADLLGMDVDYARGIVRQIFPNLRLHQL